MTEADLLDRLAQVGQLRRFWPGQMLQGQGDTERGFWLVVSGQVVIGKLDADGGMTVYKLLRGGELFGELAYFAQIERQADAIAKDVCDVVWISHEKIKQLSEKEPDLALLLLRSLARQLQEALAVIDERRRLPTLTRLAALLLRLDQPDRGGVCASQQELADLLGVSRVALVAALGRLARMGVIKRGYRVVQIPDRHALEPWARQ